MMTKYFDARGLATYSTRTESAASGTSCFSPSIWDNVLTTPSCAQEAFSGHEPAAAEPPQAPIPTFPS